jgi:acetyl/propionyl-CoA carboxylase alpha subunit
MPSKNKFYQAKVNELLLSFTHDEIENADLLWLSPGQINLVKDHQSVNAKIIQSDTSGKNMTIEMEGNSFAVQIKDELVQQLEKMGFGTAANKIIKEIKAPMPGLVLEIAVADGQEVKAGDKILILEAMKMENSILINSQAKIKRIAVTTGQAVEKGQVLVELE